MVENERMINGITFSNTEEYLQAKKELAGIAYVKENNDMSNDQTVLALYNKFVQKDVFHTQIGYEFLKGLQERLMRSENVDKSQIAKLPIRDFGDEDEKDNLYIKQDKKDKSVEKKEKVVEKKVKPSTPKTAPKKKKDVKPETKKKPLMYLEAERAAKPESELEVIRGKYKWSLFLNILLVFVIIIMAYITLNSNHVNILNYETKLQDKYASWAQELQEREEALNKLRNELNVVFPD